MHKPSFLNRFREWLKRDVEIRIFDFSKGLEVREQDLKDILIRGKLFAEDDQPKRKIQRAGSSSWTTTINPHFVNTLCPLREKYTKQQLIKQESGEFVLMIWGTREP